MTEDAIEQPTAGENSRIIDEAFARKVVPRRQAGAHKWGVGGLFLVAGAPNYVGAAALSAMAAGRAGAGIVNLVVPRSLINPLATLVPEAAFVPLPESETGGVQRLLMKGIENKIEKCKAIVVGPGLGQDEYATALVKRLLNIGGNEPTGFMGFGKRESVPADEPNSAFDWDIPILVDADALNILAKVPDWWEGLPKGRLLLTPHAGELARLTGRDGDELLADPLNAAMEAARTFGQHVLFKFGYGIVTDGKRALISDDAPASVATAGSGDVLAGTVGALLAQGLSPMDAAGLGLYVGARAARRLEATVGTLGMIASDLPLAIAQELARLERG